MAICGRLCPMLAGLSHEGCCVSLHLIRCCGHGFGDVHASLQANPEGFLVPYKVARGPLCAPVRVVTSLSPYSPRTLTRPRRFGTTWQPLPSGVWATGVPGRCVCVCVVGWCLGRASGVARVGPLHYLCTRNTLGRAPGPAASHGGPGCAGISFANIYVCYFLCVSGKSCVSNFNLPLQDSF